MLLPYAGMASFAPPKPARPQFAFKSTLSHDPSPPLDHDGFAAVDALTAVAILATTLLLSIQALDSALRVSRTGREAIEARTAFAWLMDGAPRPPGAYRGRTGGFDWTLLVVDEGNTGQVRLCRQSIELRNHRSRRRFVQEGHSVCPLPERDAP
jgi:hypothetical protein